MIPHSPLRQLHDLDRSSPRYYEQLTDFLRGNEYRDGFSSLQNDDATWLVEYLDSVLVNISDPAADLALQQSLHELGRICGIKELLPKSCTLPGSLLDVDVPSPSGRVHAGTLDGSRVRIKRVSVHHMGDRKKVGTPYQAAAVWKHLTHPNIVPLLGVTTKPVQLISDWMSGGDLTEYLANHPDTERLNILSDVAKGLNCLHSCNVIHGSLRGSNVLVDATGRARISDFGLAMITQNLDLIRSCSDGHEERARWIAPEILDSRGTYSREADVFSFAMVMVEAFTGYVPFSDKPPRAAVLAIIGGERPQRPTHPAFMDKLWMLAQQCWDQEAHLRPNLPQILDSLSTPTWKRLIDRPLAPDERISLVAELFSDHDEIEAIKYLHGDDAQSFIDVMDETLDCLGPWLRRKCLTILCRICGHHALLPRSVQIPPCYDRTDAPLYHGGFAEVWKGKYQGREVAVKVIKIYKTSDLVEIRMRFCKEVMTWKALRHQNVLPLLGVTMCNNRFAMVSEWMANGRINEFIKAHSDVNRFELLKDVARGLSYMHSQVMIHGDLKGANIMIDNDGHARLADFGLLTTVSDSMHPSTSSSPKNAGTTRWMSPELLDTGRLGFEHNRPTKESDCYALGMVILEVLTGRAPFPHDNELVVVRKVLDGERPERPQGIKAAWFTDDIWRTLTRCWSPQPTHRSTVETIFECLERASPTWQPLPSDAGSDTETSDTDDESYMAAGDPGSSGASLPAYDPSASNLSPVRDLMRMVAGGLGTEPIGPRSADERGGAPSELAVLPSTESATGGSDSLTPGGPVIDNRLNVTQPSPGKLVEFVENPTLDTAILKKLTEFDANSEDDVRELHNIFKFGDNTLFGTRDDETLVAIEVFDRVLTSPIDDPNLRSRCFRGLQKAASQRGLLPKSYCILHDSLAVLDSDFSAAGRAYVTRQGLVGRQLVAVKTINPDCITGFNVFKRELCTSAVMWKQLQHPNLVSFLGFDSDSPPFSLVYPWMANGNLSDYLGRRPNAGRLGLLLDIIQGLDYLHQCNLVHGNLTAHNILVHGDGYACISDYGLEIVLRDEGHAKPIRRNARWAAPEVLGASNTHIPPGDDGKAVDVYSLGVVMFEILTGATPFPNESNEEIAGKVVGGQRPELPSKNPPRGFAEVLWKQIKTYWKQEPKERPAASSVLEALLDYEDHQRESLTPVGKQDDDTIIEEWEYPHLGNLSDSVSSFFTGLKTSHPNGDGAHKSVGRRRRLGKRVRDLLHLPQQPMTEPAERHEPLRIPRLVERPNPAGKPKPGVELIDQREENVFVRDDRIPYLVSRQIPEGKSLKKVVITIVSKDQGWSSYEADHGTYRNSWTWFELSVGPSEDSEKWCGEVVRNLHAHDEFKEHTVEITDGELYKKAKSGDVLTVWALARHSGWRNRVKKVTIRYVAE